MQTRTGQFLRAAFEQFTPETEQNLLEVIATDVCMTPPGKSFSGDIDLVGDQQEPPELADPALPPAAYVVQPSRPERYHSMQVALVTGLFACGGFICSILLVDGSDDFLRPLWWPRKSYSSPQLATPQKPVTAPVVPQSGTFKSNGEEKNATLQDSRVGDRKPLASSPVLLAAAGQNSVLRG